MNKSEAIRAAIEAVIRDDTLEICETADILEQLYPEYAHAKWSENLEEEQKA